MVELVWLRVPSQVYCIGPDCQTYYMSILHEYMHEWNTHPFSTTCLIEGTGEHSIGTFSKMFLQLNRKPQRDK